MCLILLRESAMDTKHVITNVFSHCVKTLLGSFDFIVIFLFKILKDLSSVGFILCRKKQRLKYCITCTAKHVHCAV